MDIGLILRGSEECIFRKYLHFIQITLFTYVFGCTQGVQVGSICRIQLRASDIAVSPDILRLF